LLEAQDAVIAHLIAEGGIGKLIGTGNMRYSIDGVVLNLAPTRVLTWGMWANALRGPFQFVTRWGAVEMVFEIQMEGFREAVGRGSWSGR